MKPLEQVYGKLTALTVSPSANPAKALVLLHGVGSNERDLLELAPLLTDDHLVVSLRAPMEIAPDAFAWFHVQFTPQGPVHNWDEAKKSVELIEEALREISKKNGIPLEEISIFGFSQGAILTVGLALTSRLNLENYVASSGRTLPEFAKAASEHPLPEYKSRRVYVTHGTQDSKLPIQLGRGTAEVLRATALNFTYKEYECDHTISSETASDVKKWLA